MMETSTFSYVRGVRLDLMITIVEKPAHFRAMQGSNSHWFTLGTWQCPTIGG